MTTEDSPKPDDTDIDALDLIALWRTVPITKIDSPVLGRLRAALIECARNLDDGREIEPLLLRAQARDAAVWIELADRLRTPEWLTRDEVASRWGDWIDAHASCLLIAASYRSRWASALLVLLLAQRGLDESGYEERIAVMHALGRRYILSSADPTIVIENLGVKSIIEADLELELALRSPPPPPPPQKKEPEPAPESASDFGGDRIQVLLQAPEATGDRDTKALAERYGVLRLPVPLSPMPDPDELAINLLAEFPWAGEVVGAICEELHLVRRLAGQAFRLPPLLLLGDPGIGKSTFAKRFCALANVPSAVVFAGGATDNRSLAGTARGWSSATPCFPLTTIRRYMTANPIILVEEIDKSGGSARNGRLADTLTAMLDPTVHGAWLDECLQVAVDLSRVTWLLTANRLDQVPPAIRARCRIVSFPRPRPQDFDVLLSGVLRDIADEYEVEPQVLPDLPVEAIGEMRRGFEAGRLQARQLANLVRRLLSSQTMAERHYPHH
jgi:hypothetical protein